jgi:hypothetical protein
MVDAPTPLSVLQGLLAHICCARWNVKGKEVCHPMWHTTDTTCPDRGVLISGWADAKAMWGCYSQHRSAVIKQGWSQIAPSP